MVPQANPTRTATVGALLQFEVTARVGEQTVVEGMLVLAEAVV